jgi:outer membrane lipoprotein-sorting protein
VGKKIALIMLLVLFVVLFGCSKEQTQLDTVISNVQQLGESFESFSAEMLAMASNTEGDINEVIYTLYYSKGLFRIEWLDEDGNVQGNLFDGNDLWHYIKGEQDVFVVRNFQGPDHFAFLHDFGKGYDDLEYLGTEEVEGYKTHVIAGTKILENGVIQEVTCWIDEGTWFPFISENTISGVTARAVYRNFAVNPSLDKSLFIFIPPSDAIIYERTNDPSLPPR